jgi:hypothetical protein
VNILRQHRFAHVQQVTYDNRPNFPAVTILTQQGVSFEFFGDDKGVVYLVDVLFRNSNNPLRTSTPAAKLPQLGEIVSFWGSPSFVINEANYTIKQFFTRYTYASDGIVVLCDPTTHFDTTVIGIEFKPPAEIKFQMKVSPDAWRGFRHYPLRLTSP